MDHFQPDDASICSTFKLTTDELATARSLRNSGTFVASKTLDVSSYNGIFSTGIIPPTKSTPARTVHINPQAGTSTAPESASKRIKVPQKRGRKGDNITIALMQAPVVPMPVTAFIEQYGVSLAVLRQSKRFIDKMDAETASKIGKVVVKQDKITKTLLIWREPKIS
jgi:hypothetical protein